MMYWAESLFGGSFQPIKIQYVYIYIIALMFFADHSIVEVDAKLPLGAKRKEEQLYDGELFKCKDGKRTILSIQVNDNYCDCGDGSDEPGTAACSGISSTAVMFSCTAEGFPEKQIFASRVGDGVCDCCDGSDEHDFDTTICANDCEEVYARELKMQQRRIQEFSQAVVKRKTLVEKGQKAKAERSQMLKEAEGDVAIAHSKFDEAEVLVQEAEKEEELAAEAAKEAHLKYAQEVLGIGELTDAELVSLMGHLTEQLGSYSELFFWALLEDNRQTQDLSKREIKKLQSERQKKLKELGLPEDIDEMSKMEQLSHSLQALAMKPADKLRYMALMFVQDMESAPLFHGLVLESLGKEIPACLALDANEEEKEGEPVCSVEDLAKIDEITDAVNKLNGPFTTEKADQAREIANLADDEVKRAEKQVAKIEAEMKLERDFGFDQQFYELSTICAVMEGKKGQASYTICPFHEVTQQDSSQKYDLGSYKSLSPIYSDLGLWLMQFEGGQKCWNGPERSAKVFLDCGLATEIIQAEEPSICEYQFVLTTPAACDKAYAQHHNLIQ